MAAARDSSWAPTRGEGELAMRVDLDAVRFEPGLGRHQRVVAGGAVRRVADLDQRHALRRAQQGQRVAHRVRGLPRSLPGDQHVLSDRGEHAGVGDDEDRRAGVEEHLLRKVEGEAVGAWLRSV